MCRKNHYAIARLGMTAFLLAASLLSVHGLTPPMASLSESIKAVPSAPASGAAKPHHPYVSRKTLTSAEISAPLDFEVVLKMRNFSEFQGRVNKGEHVPLPEVAAKYEPLPKDYQTVVQWLTSQGLTITRQDNHHTAIFARGTIGQIQKAMQVTFAKVTLENKEYTSAVTAPNVPSTLSSLLLGINGLQPHLHAHKHMVRPDDSVGSATYTPAQIEQAYQASGLYAAGITGAGQTIAIVIDTFPLDSDLTKFWSTYGINQSISNVTFIQAVTGTNDQRTGEETLDTEWTSALAPGAKIRVYAATDLGYADLDETYLKVYDDVTTSNPALPIHVMSMSFGAGEIETTNPQMQADDYYFVDLANAGVTCFASSGDDGATPGEDAEGNQNEDGSLEVESPASDPNVIAVGGTTLTSSANANAFTETVWNNSYGASGGGASDYWPRPTWQTGAGVPSGSKRLVPDIACAGDPNYGGAVYYTDPVDGLETSTGGTSWSCQMCAGFCALINQALANNGLSAIGGQFGLHTYPLIGTTSFRDINNGTNATSVSSSTNGVPNYTAGVGYDETTGIGVPLVQNLAQALIGGQTVVAQTALQTVNQGQNATFTVTAGGSPVSYQWQRMPAGTTTWSSLGNNTVYSGATTATLTVSNTTTAMSGDQFQCVVTYAGSVTLTSNPASTLIVEVPWSVSTLAGQAGTTGLPTTSQFNYPTGVTLDSAGNLYIADLDNNAIRKVTPQGVVTTPYGSTAGTAGSTNGMNNSALFNEPRDIAGYTPSGSSTYYLYVSDEGNNAVREINTTTGLVSTIPSSVTIEGKAEALYEPKGICVDSSGNIYVADSGNNIIRKIAATNGTIGATPTVTIFAGSNTFAAGYQNGTGTEALFNEPLGLTIDTGNNIYVTDYYNEVVRKITSVGVVTTVAGQPGIAGCLDGTSTNAEFNVPRGIAVDSSGNLYVADSYPPVVTQGTGISGNNLLREITSAGVVTTLAGQAGVPGSLNGAGSAAEFYNLCGVAMGSGGQLYVTDASNNTIRAATIASTLSLTATQPTAMAFGPTPGLFTVTRTGDLSSSLTVDYAVAGTSTAVPGTDYSALSDSVTIPVNASSAVISVNPIADSQAVSSPMVQLTLDATPPYSITGTGMATVTIQEMTPFQAWETAEFPGETTNPSYVGESADPYHTDVPNFLQYAFNGNPTLPGVGPLPIISTVESGGQEYLAVTYTQLNTDTNLTYTVQVTSDLTQLTDTWHSGSTYTAVVSQVSNGNTTQVTVRDNTPISSGLKRFIRVEVSGD